jgi:hypothetical protein
MKQLARPLRKAAALLAVTAALNQITTAATPGLVAHEWGTFTSVQGADGVQMGWNPFVAEDLPRFVRNHNQPGAGDTVPDRPQPVDVKGSYSARQRMETPVIYLYSPEPVTVEVEVVFREGLITEWFPTATAYAPKTPMAGMKPIQIESGWISAFNGGPDSSIRWAGVAVTTPGPGTTPPLPKDHSGSHYYAARETDSAVLQVPGPGGGPTEQEKFLFYRGIGQFVAPLNVSVESDETTLRLRNTGEEPLHDVFVVEIREGRGGLTHLDAITAGGAQSVARVETAAGETVETLRARLGAEMSAALTKSGLFPREADAMVKTWSDSWFAEEGVRALYLLPRGWTDRTLPLRIRPAPRDVVRTMVGRAEVITPALEKALRDRITRFSAAGPGERQAIVREVDAMKLGRFMAPAMRRAGGAGVSREFREQAAALEQAVAAEAWRRNKVAQR